MADFNGVEDTLFIPLVGRIYASKNFQEFFYDSKALELEKYIKSDLIKENTGEYFTIAAIARYYEFDKLAKSFIEANKGGNILCLGCGFETMAHRINDNRATFYEIDMPKVIKQRESVLGNLENEILIGSDILDYSWMDMVDTTKPTLAIVSGVFQYLKHKQVIDLIDELKNRFDSIEIAFDATNKTGIKKAEEYVKKTGNSEAMMYFYVDDCKAFAAEVKSTLIARVPFYKNSSRILKKKLKLSTKFLCFFGDRLGFTKILHLKLN